VPRTSRGARAVLALILAALCSAAPGRASAAGDDLLQSVRSMAVQCRDDFRSGNDAAANQSCHGLEHVLDTSVAPTANALMAKKSAGKRLSREEFFFLMFYVSTERLVTNTMARLYYRVRDVHPEALRYGREFAAQAISWSLYDAMNIHELFELAKADGNDAAQTHQARDIQRMMRANEAEDKKNPAQLEAMYPGVTAKALSSMHMSRQKYDHIMATV
jgi:hypothetical protein